MPEGQEWTLAKTRDWVIQLCWEEHKSSPAGLGKMVNQNDIDPQGPPWKQFLEACQYLEGKKWITCEYGMSMGGQPYPHYVNHLKLTTAAIAAIQDQLEAAPSKPVGFIID